MKKQFLSPVLIIVAMLLLVIPKLMRREPLDWLGYSALGLILLVSIGIYVEYRKIK